VLLNVAPAHRCRPTIVRMLDWLIVNETEAMIVAESLGRHRDNAAALRPRSPKPRRPR